MQALRRPDAQMPREVAEGRLFGQPGQVRHLVARGRGVGRPQRQQQRAQQRQHLREAQRRALPRARTRATNRIVLRRPAPLRCTLVGPGPAGTVPAGSIPSATPGAAHPAHPAPRPRSRSAPRHMTRAHMTSARSRVVGRGFAEGAGTALANRRAVSAAGHAPPRRARTWERTDRPRHAPHSGAAAARPGRGPCAWAHTAPGLPQRPARPADTGGDPRRRAWSGEQRGARHPVPVRPRPAQPRGQYRTPPAAAALPRGPVHSDRPQPPPASSCPAPRG